MDHVVLQLNDLDLFLRWLKRDIDEIDVIKVAIDPIDGNKFKFQIDYGPWSPPIGTFVKE